MQIAHFSRMNICFIKRKCVTQITYPGLISTLLPPTAGFGRHTSRAGPPLAAIPAATGRARTGLDISARRRRCGRAGCLTWTARDSDCARLRLARPPSPGSPPLIREDRAPGRPTVPCRISWSLLVGLAACITVTVRAARHSDRPARLGVTRLGTGVRGW